MSHDPLLSTLLNMGGNQPRQSTPLQRALDRLAYEQRVYDREMNAPRDDHNAEFKLLMFRAGRINFPF